jgi:hypothetical protein
MRTSSLPLNLSTPARNRIATVGLINNNNNNNNNGNAGARDGKGSWKRLLMSSLDRCNRCMTMARPLMSYDDINDDLPYGHMSSSTEEYYGYSAYHHHSDSPLNDSSHIGSYGNGYGTVYNEYDTDVEQTPAVGRVLRRKKRAPSRQTVPVIECSGCSLRWCVTADMERWLSYVNSIGFITHNKHMIALSSSIGGSKPNSLQSSSSSSSTHDEHSSNGSAQYPYVNNK